MASILVFGFDLTEASQIRRIRSFIAAGALVSSATMRRRNMNAGFRPGWPDTHLATVANERLFLRLGAVLWAIAKLAVRPAAYRSADIFYARNFDMLLIARALQCLRRRRPPRLVYECLDIHGLFTRRDPLGAFMRWAERRLLRRIDALVISSPGYEREYFSPLQNYAGPVLLVENKLWFDGAPIPRPDRPRRVMAGAPLTLGWVGTIRCAASMDVLTRLADAMGDDLVVNIHGVVHHHAIPDFDARIGRRPNMRFHGAYRYPDDLATVYGGCDLVWAQDLWQRGANSDWLLPNRIYEASWFGCPSLALAGTETGNRVAADGLGIVLASLATPDILAALRGLTARRIEDLSRRILRMPEDRFRLTPKDVHALIAAMSRPG